MTKCRICEKRIWSKRKVVEMGAGKMHVECAMNFIVKYVVRDVNIMLKDIRFIKNSLDIIAEEDNCVEIDENIPETSYVAHMSTGGKPYGKKA